MLALLLAIAAGLGLLLPAVQVLAVLLAAAGILFSRGSPRLT
jgi:hypothetical protein